MLSPENSGDYEKITALSARLEQLHTDLDETTEDWAEASEALEELEREQESC